MTSKQQYDNMQGPYDYLRTGLISFIERDNVQGKVKHFIEKARVLELACGTGFYTYSFLQWGASSVLGVDISSAMINEARRQGKDVSFIKADCSIPQLYDGGKFDLVFAAWLLNYAPDRAGLVQMFRNVAMNLKDGGHFVAITPPPSSNPIDSLNAENHVRHLPMPVGSGYLIYKHIKDVEDGIYFQAYCDTPRGELSFYNYHLKREIYEEAAREVGLRIQEWDVTKVPEVHWVPYLEEMNTYNKVPCYGVLVIVK